MSQIAQIPVPNDATVVGTLYYETQWRITGMTSYASQLNNSPLPTMAVLSPAGTVPYVQLPPLADGTDYEFQMRRFDANSNPSAWFTGTFTTP